MEATYIYRPNQEQTAKTKATEPLSTESWPLSSHGPDPDHQLFDFLMTVS